MDAQGNAWLPVACRQGRELSFTLIRASGDAGIASVALKPPVEARSVAVGWGGALYVLGVDPGFFRGTTPDCHLITQYTAEGERIRSFSSCPVSGVTGAGPTRRDGVDYEQLKLEADHGRVWLQGSHIQHLLPQTSRLRAFSADGSPIRAVSFEPPPASPGADSVIHAMFPLGDGRFLLFWRSAFRQGNAARGSVGAALHGPDGDILSELAGPERFAGMAPAYVNSSGECIFHRLEPGAGKFTLWKADLLLQ